ncbi:MAG TPA: ArsC/Spx/MgsR family protein [Bryobacteraceae bacterium]|nr:ArsC/Spx/MgsR family protein [Bryobacteraceae bacterium]
MPNVQIFGVKNSQPTRAAERFFKERRISFQWVDLAQRAMAPAEIKRFIDRFGLSNLIDQQSAAHEKGGLKYLKTSDAELIGRVERDPKLMRLPLVRSGKFLSIGDDPSAWEQMLGD